MRWAGHVERVRRTHIVFSGGKYKMKNNYEGSEIGWKMILKWILGKRDKVWTSGGLL
jgi:hypothetical protein